MRHLLVIANLHHASPRIPALIDPLLELGWQATVVTPALGKDAISILGLPKDFTEKVKIVVAPYRGDIFWVWRLLLSTFGFSGKSSYTEQIKERFEISSSGPSWVDNCMNAYQTVFAIPDTEWPWRRSALSEARKLLGTHRFDAILSSSPFPTVHCVASRLKKEYSIKWIADFRDPWSQSHNYALPKMRRKLDRWLERRTLGNADLITTVSSGVAEKLILLHGAPVKVIRNGYQPIAKTQLSELPARFTISYTGTIYKGKQDPNMVLLALRKLIDNGSILRERIALHFYGRYDNALQQAIVSNKLEDVVLQLGVLPRAEIRWRQRSSHLLLLLQWEDADERGIFPLKFYEYLDSGRHILATGGAFPDEIGAILEETKTGVTAASIEEVERYILRAYEDYLSQGISNYEGIPNAINRYSYSGCAKQLVEYLEQVCKPSTKL